MDDFMFVDVPSELGELLKEADFGEVESDTRSGDQWLDVARAVLSVGVEGLDVSAGAVGIYLAREQIADFGRRTAAWFGFRVASGRASGSGPETATAEGASLVLTVTAGAEDPVRIEIRSTPGPDGTPVLDSAALVDGLVTAIDATRPAPGTPSETAG
ncbi:hypothetical protein [Streptomyces sp. NPDC048606]|uniref:hypothetical protein n=1 Tax=Streptomyces sp. NPDC048606 TaxID=3154726 RepID=UPI0034283C18